MKKQRKIWKEKRRGRVAMVAVAACALVVATSPTDASQMPTYVESAKAMIAAIDEDLPKVESIQIVGRTGFSPDVMSAITTAKRLDTARALDWRLRKLFRARFVHASDILHLRYCVEMKDFTHTIRGWKSAARHQIYAAIDDVSLFTHDGRPNIVMEEVWEGFRRRIRREGALQRILDGNIRHDLA